MPDSAADHSSEAFEQDQGAFRLRFGPGRDGRDALVIQGSGNGRHKAVHTHFNLLGDGGEVLRRAEITAPVARFIANHFKQRGATESFNIYRGDLEAGRLLPRKDTTLDPAQIRHAKTREEESFTATGSKLYHHWPIFEKLRDSGFGSIIRATLTLHQVCASRCQFCSTILRNKRDSITLAEAQAFVTKLYSDQADFNRTAFPDHNARYRQVAGSDIRLKGLILSGGGQPNLWPPFTDFVEWLAERDIDLGLITNGFPPKVPEAVYQHFKWIRLSVTPEDASPFYPDRRFDKQYLPATILANPEITVGLSYVYGPWTDDDILRRLDATARERGFAYCRLLTDCNLSRGAQLRAHQDLSERLLRLGLIEENGQPTSKIFHQLKYHGQAAEADSLWSEGQCYLQSYNVFWDTTGHEEAGRSHCYPCDSVTVLAEETSEGTVAASERRFNPQRWGTVTNDQVERLYREPLRPAFDPRQTCRACLFMRNNQTVKALMQAQSYESLPLDPGLDHRNFP